MTREEAIAIIKEYKPIIGFKKYRSALEMAIYALEKSTDDYVVDTDKLVDNLKLDLEWAEANEWESPICLSDDIREAINIIKIYNYMKRGNNNGL